MGKVRKILLVAGAALATVIVAGFAVPPDGYRGAPSDHFDGERFSNLVDASHGSVLDFLAMRMTTEYARWPRWVETEPAPAPPRRLGRGEVRATFVNHATVLLQLGPVNILTDPTWAERASPLGWAGPRRVHSPGVRFEDLPPIHAVIVSHNHYDHLDLATLRRLAAAHRPRVLVGLGLEGWLAARGVEGAEQLDWWESVELGRDTRVTFTPTQHWSSRGLRDRRRTLWGGFVLEHAGRSVYFAGDTAAGPHFARVGEHFDGVALALLPIGAYAPRDFMGSAHLSPEEAVAAHHELRARRSMAIHFGTFQLSQEAREAPGRRLAVARAAAGLTAAEFVVPAVGETLEITGTPASPPVDAPGTRAPKVSLR
jgi:L-ascorbate metabolism protein UlaG (beta-lactamase superfamily)